MRAAERSLFTVLFTDIVGSTDRAAELGDRRWRDSLERHHAAVRREIRRFGGREVATAGDSFLVLFDEPAPAILCAVAMRDAVRQVGLEIRCGLHMGSIEQTDGDVGGIGVHIAARVMGHAAPSEVLVSRTVRDAESGSDFGFEEAGAYELKGIPGTWQLFRITSVPIGTARSLVGKRRKGRSTSRRALLGSALAGLMLVLGGLYLLRRAAGPDLKPEEAVAAAAPGIAVLPFRITDPDLEIWGEGMVDLLSTNLDGVAGFRTIDSRTVMARWGEAGSQESDADLATSLDVARRTGAMYAVLGTAVGIGPDVRLAAEVYYLDSGASIGEAQVQGPADSVLLLVDRLSIDILRAILPNDAEQLPPAPRLSSVTTTSVIALKAYLEGEARYRRSDFRGAMAAYERAIEADSLFALAYYRLSEAGSWVVGQPGFSENIDRALKHAARLPVREATLVLANQAMNSGKNPYRALDLLREAVQRHPDDPEAWYLMGDTYVHYGPQILAEEDGSRGLARAAELAPTFAPFQIHLLEIAFQSGDSAAAARRMRTYSRAAAGDARERASRLAFALVFGDSAARAQAWVTLDTVSTEVLTRSSFLLAPGDREKVLRTARVRLDATSLDADFLFWSLRAAGKLEAAFAQLGDSLVLDEGRTAGFYHLALDGLEIPAERIEAAISLQLADTTSWFYAGALAADRGRWADHKAAVGALRKAARDGETVGDSVRARVFSGAADALDGYALWRRGEPRAALPVLEEARRDVVYEGYWNGTIRWWLGLLHIELGRRDEAIRYLESLVNEHPWGTDTFAAYQLGPLYEEQGEVTKAIHAYDYVASAWREADLELAPRVEAARLALSRLVGAQD